MCFEVLFGVYGVGLVLVLVILLVYFLGGLREVVVAVDLCSLCLVFGVGKKMVEWLLIELKDWFDVFDFDLVVVVRGASVLSGFMLILVDVREVLVGFGYIIDEVREVLRDVVVEGCDALGLLREVFKVLGVCCV